MGFTVFSNHQCALSIQKNKDGTIELGFYDQNARQLAFELDHVQLAWWLIAFKNSPETPLVWQQGDYTIKVRLFNNKYQIEIEKPDMPVNRCWFSKAQGASIAETLLTTWTNQTDN